MFASMFSVAAPYNGTDPSSFYKNNPKGIELTMIDIIFVFFAGAVFFIVVGTTAYFCCCRRKIISPIPEHIVYNQNYPTAQDLATANGAYAAAVAHSHSIDFSNSADAYYVDPAHTLSPSAPVRTQAVEIGVVRASSVGSDFGPEGEPDLIPDSDLRQAEENELARQKDIMELLEMGFTFDIAENALENCNWDKARAIDHLTRSNPNR
jgi:UBA/TS-N domain